jgi:hypothetical protein
MIDVFTQEIEDLIKEGITHLYWYKDDLKKAWKRSGVDEILVENIFRRKDDEGRKLSKRQLNGVLYDELRNLEYNTRLSISRNFVRILIEHQDFTPKSERHQIKLAERVSLKLKEIVSKQHEEKVYKENVKTKAQKASKNDYDSELMQIREQFIELQSYDNKQKRGLEFEKLFNRLMIVSGIPVENSFKITGEQIDGAIKYDSRYYLVELKWWKKKASQAEISSLYVKTEGKFEAKGIFIAMEGFSDEALKSLPHGKNLKILLLDGIHISRVIFGNYTFQELMEHSLSSASLKGKIYCSHDLK